MSARDLPVHQHFWLGLVRGSESSTIHTTKSSPGAKQRRTIHFVFDRKGPWNRLSCRSSCCRLTPVGSFFCSSEQWAWMDGSAVQYTNWHPLLKTLRIHLNQQSTANVTLTRNECAQVRKSFSECENNSFRRASKNSERVPWIFLFNQETHALRSILIHDPWNMQNQKTFNLERILAKKSKNGQIQCFFFEPHMTPWRHPPKVLLCSGGNSYEWECIDAQCFSMQIRGTDQFRIPLSEQASLVFRFFSPTTSGTSLTATRNSQHWSAKHQRVCFLFCLDSTPASGCGTSACVLFLLYHADYMHVELQFLAIFSRAVNIQNMVAHAQQIVQQNWNWITLTFWPLKQKFGLTFVKVEKSGFKWLPFSDVKSASSFHRNNSVPASDAKGANGACSFWFWPSSTMFSRCNDGQTSQDRSVKRGSLSLVGCVFMFGRDSRIFHAVIKCDLWCSPFFWGLRLRQRITGGARLIRMHLILIHGLF